MNNKIFPYEYKLTQGQYFLEDYTYTGYGISVISKETNETIICIDNITTSRTRLSDLIKLCNELSLDPLHIHDVVEDFLS